MPFIKGHKLATGRPTGSKNTETLLREERRMIFERKASEKWEKIIDKLPPTYIADQFMGKAIDELKITGSLTTPDSDIQAIAEGVVKSLKEQKLNESTN